MVFHPPGALKNSIAEAAKFLALKIPGGKSATYTKHCEAGLAVIKPVELGVRAKDVQPETLFLPSDGKRGSGKRVWKTYPTLLEWGGDVEVVILDETVLQTSQRSGNPILQDICEGAGQFIGFGRFRPRQNGWYGRFTIEDFKVHK